MNGQSLQFVPTAEQLAVSLDIIEDMLVEGVEDFMFSLTSPTVGGQPHPGIRLGAQQNTQILIEDNDGEIIIINPWHSCARVTVVVARCELVLG